MAKEIIVIKSYELLKFTIPTINRIPKNQKFTFGDRLQNHLHELLDMLIEASYLSRTAKRPILDKANLQIEKLRYLFRLGFELGLYSNGKYREFSVRLEEIGRMTGGWLKSLK